MRKCVIGIISALFAGEMQGKGGVEQFLDAGLFESVITTPTNMMVQMKDEVVYFVEYNPKHRNPTPRGDPQRDWNYTGKSEVLNLTPDQEVILSEHHGKILFTPVSFKDHQKGIRILIASSWGREEITNTAVTTYIALGDTLEERSEDDVEMILDGNRRGISWDTSGKMEWKKYEKSQSVPKEESEAQETPPSREKPVAATDGETPVNVAGDEPSEEKNKATTFWLYTLIPLCLLAAVFYFLRRKK